MARLTKGNRSIAGRVAIVTGAASGMGRATAHLFADEGAKVAVIDLGEDRVKTVVEEINGAGGTAQGWVLDVSDPDGVQRVVDEVRAAFGPIDILVNNAGITRDGTMKRMNREMWDAVIDTNLGSCYNMCKLVWDGMSAKKFGRIVNIGSINGQAGQYGQVNYAAAKSGIHGFTKALALEVAKKGVTINTISPGYIGTKMVTAIPKEILDSKILPQIPVGRLGKPEEIAGLIIYLCSDEAAFVTGANISINGGQHMY
jgi:acetoacetyl-CoA reductase